MKCCERSQPGPAADHDFNHLVSAKAAAKQLWWPGAGGGWWVEGKVTYRNPLWDTFKGECMPSPFA